MRRLVLLVALAFGVCLAAVMGCSPKKILAPKSDPETTVFVQGTLDTVSYRVHLYWFGSDPDGYVVGYELRFVDPDVDPNPAWIRTTQTDSVFQVFTPDGLSEPTFEVRAIDDDGNVDPTPASQDFKFRNLPPTLRIDTGPGVRDTTFASVTLSWHATDPDGNVNNASYRVWLDGNQANANVTTTTNYTVPTAQFLQGGQLRSGQRKLFVQVIDDGGYAAPPESLSWYVRAPVTGTRARLLLVDDVTNENRETFRQDTLFSNTAARNLPADSYSILRLQFTQPFRSTQDLEQTLKLFEAVVWYRGTYGIGGNEPHTVLQDFPDAVASYLESGGQFFIESQAVVTGHADPGIFPESWVSRFFGSDYLYLGPTGTKGDSSVAWGIAGFDDQNNPTHVHSSTFDEVLENTQIFGQLRGFAVRDTHNVALWARTGSLTQHMEFDIPIGVSVAQPSGGRLISITTPLRSCDALHNVPRFLAKVFQQMGLTGSGTPHLAARYRSR